MKLERKITQQIHPLTDDLTYEQGMERFSVLNTALVLLMWPMYYFTKQVLSAE
jgi:hypothetical protein